MKFKSIIQESKIDDIIDYIRIMEKVPPKSMSYKEIDFNHAWPILVKKFPNVDKKILKHLLLNYEDYQKMGHR